MVGPSSSHTAGACKIGQFARAIFHHTPKKVTFYLHGSFGEVYKGHATDRALLAGVMKFRTSDPRLRNSFKIADQKKLEYKFIVKDLGDKYHPNTVKIVLEDGKNKMSVIGCSVGGGMIEIMKIDDFDIHLHASAGKSLSLIVSYDKKHKVLEVMTKELKKLGIEILSTETTNYKDQRLTLINTEGRRIKLSEIVELEKNIPGIDFLRSLSKLEK